MGLLDDIVSPPMSALHGDGPCALCGHDPACGVGSVTVDGEEVWLCHPDHHVSCYHLWTVYGMRPGGDGA